MELYWIYLHIICAFLSLGLLIVRGGMQLTQRNWRAVKLLKSLPHSVVLSCYFNSTSA